MAASLFKWFMISYFGLAGASRVPGDLRITNTGKATDLHPYYISVVEINHNATEKTLEISCKIFTNDFEATLEKNVKAKVDLSNPKDKASDDKWINDYIKSHLSIKADGRDVHFTYVGFEKEEEAIYSYFQVDNIPSVKNIDINDSILHDFSDQQINIIHCTVGGKRQSTKLDFPKTAASFSW